MEAIRYKGKGEHSIDEFEQLRITRTKVLNTKHIKIQPVIGFR